MAVTNVFFPFPCFIERWLVNNNINNNNINAQYFVNKNEIIGHVRLDNNNITSFRAPVSGYLTILIREGIRVRKGLNVAAIHPSISPSNHSNNQLNHQIIQNQLNHQSPQFDARFQNNMNQPPQTMNTSQPGHTLPPRPNTMVPVAPQIHPQNIQFHTQVRHSPHQHHMPINTLNIMHHTLPPPLHYMHGARGPPPPHFIHNPPTIMYANQPRPPYAPPQPQPPMAARATYNIPPQPTQNMKSETKVPIIKPEKSPQDPRRSTSCEKGENIKREIPKNSVNNDKTSLTTSVSPTATPNAMFTKHWNNKNSSINNTENMEQIKINLHKNKKLLLVLDIDHTLVHATRDIRAKDILSDEIIGEDVYEIEFIDPSCSSIKQVYWVKLRPFLRKFLQVLKRFFCLAIYTMGIRPYADEILKIIDPDSSIFEHRMICRGDDGINQINGMKDISHLPQCDPKMILIADDRDDVWTTPNNVVKVHKFRYWPNENNLAIISDNNIENNTQFRREQLFPWNKDNILEKEGMEPWNLQRLKEKSNDNILYNTANILQAVHYVYYSCFDSSDGNEKDNADCRLIYGDMRKFVFSGVKCAFSGVIPTNEDPRNHPLWKLIESYGGEPVDCLSTDCTHLIAAKPGTFKVTKSSDMNIWIVHYNWVYQSVIQFVKCDELKYTNLKKPDNIHSFIPKYVHVKPKEFGDGLKQIRNGSKKLPKIISKHQRMELIQKEQILQKQQKEQKQQNEKMDVDIIEKEEQEQDMEVEMEMDDKEKDEESEEGEIKEHSPPPKPQTPPPQIQPQPQPKIKTETNETQQNINNNNVNIVINNIQLPPPNASVTDKHNKSSELPEYIQLPTHKKQNNNNNINNNNNNDDNNSLPSHIALPEKNKNKILAQHQTNVAKLRIFKADIQTHHNGIQVIQSQPPKLQAPKPQVIQIQAPTFNQSRCHVPTIPAHLKQNTSLPSTTQSTNNNNTNNNNNNYIPPSMLPPPNSIQNAMHIQHIQHIQIAPPRPRPPVTVSSVIPQQPPPPNAALNGVVSMQQMLGRPPMVNMMHINAINNNIQQQKQPKLQIQPPQLRNNANKIHPHDKDHRKDKNKHKDYGDIDHRKTRDKQRERHYNNNNNNNNNYNNRHKRSRSISRSRSRSRSRSPSSRGSHNNHNNNHHRQHRDRRRSRSPNPYRSSHSSSLSYRDRERDRDWDSGSGSGSNSRRNRDKRYRRRDRNMRGRNGHRNRYDVIRPKNVRRMQYDDELDEFDQMLQSHVSETCSHYNRYSDEEPKIDYGVGTNDNNKNDNKEGKDNDDSIDYSAI